MIDWQLAKILATTLGALVIFAFVMAMMAVFFETFFQLGCPS